MSWFALHRLLSSFGTSLPHFALVALSMALLPGCGNEEDPEPPNQAPVFSSPSTFNVSENTRGIATIAASDPENQPVSLRIGGGADGALFRLAPDSGELSFGSAPDFELPRDANGDNLYEVFITATDGDGVSASVPVVVAVLDLAEAPEIQAPSLIEIPEEQPYAYVINATDPEGTAVSFNVEGGADAGLFSIEPATGVLRLDEVPDFEAPQDANGDNYHEVQVGVRDGAGELATHDLAVRVTEVNEPPMITSAEAASVPENTRAVSALTAVDPEGEPLSYSITGGDDGAWFQVGAQSGELVFLQAPDFEAPNDQDSDNLYRVQVSVTDYRGATGQQLLEVEVTDRARDVRSTLVFPPPGAHFGGRVDQMALVGRLTDLENPVLSQADINYIKVDGKTVFPDAGDARSWHALIPVEAVNKEIPVEVAMADGSLHQSQALLRNAPFFDASSVAVDPAENRALIPGLTGSGRIVGVDLAGYQREVVGECAGIHRVDHLVFDDPGNQVIVAARSEAGVASLWRVNITSSGCSRFSGDGAGSGPALGTITGLALDEDVDLGAGEHERVLVVNGDDDTVLAVDAVNGDRTVFAGNGTGMAPDFSGLGDLVLDTAGYRAMLPATGGTDTLYELDLAGGLLSTVAQPLQLQPGSPVAASSFRGEAYLVNGAGAIDAISLSDGQTSTLVARGQPGEPAYLGEVQGLAMDASSDRLLIASEDARPTGQLLFARAWSGEKTLITSNAVGEGPGFQGVRDMAVDEVAGKAWVLDQGADSAITAVDLRAGERTRHPLTHFTSVLSLEYDFDLNRLLVLGEPADGNVPHELVAVNLPDYSVRVISGFQVTGPAPVSPGPLALDQAGDRVVVADAGLDALLAVDLDTGEHDILSGNSLGTGPMLDQISDLVVDAAGDRIIAVETTRGLLGIDMQSGNRTDLLPADMAGHHPDAGLESISLDTTGSTLFITGVQGREVQRIDPAADTVETLAELDTPPGQAMDELVAMHISPYSGLAWLVGNSGRVLVMDNDSGQWAVLSR